MGAGGSGEVTDFAGPFFSNQSLKRAAHSEVERGFEPIFVQWIEAVEPNDACVCGGGVGG